MNIRYLTRYIYNAKMWRFSGNFAIFSDRQNFGRRNKIRRIIFKLISIIVASSIHIVLEKLVIWWWDKWTQYSIMNWMSINFQRPRRHRVLQLYKMRQLIWEAYSWEYTGELRETERVELNPLLFQNRVSIWFKSLNF